MTEILQPTSEYRTEGEVAETVRSCPDDIAHVLAGNFERHLRYVAAWKCWLSWDGMRWRRDATLLVPDLVRQIGRNLAQGVTYDIEDDEQALRIAQRLMSPGSLAAAERLARTDQRIAADRAQWDRDPDLLNTPAGIVDTRTGALGPHDAGARMTRVTAVAPAAPGTPHPLWSRFLDRVTRGDAALAFYLQRLAGYALTGHGVEQALFFAHGSGANGKSVFIGTLARLLGDYADVSDLDVLAAPSPARRAAELARLDGARLVTVADAGDGRPWPVARLKALTDGTPVAAGSAGGMTPGFKLLMSGSEKPHLARVDESVRRRLQLVPFGATIPEDERDPHLMRKLEAEHPAILRWAIDGALAWRKLGLAPPASLRDARDGHCAAEDVLGQWLDACIATSGPGWTSSGWTSSAELYASWCAWAEAAGEPPGSQKRLSLLLEARGIERKRTRTGHHGFAGIRLRADDANASSSVIGKHGNEPVEPVRSSPPPERDRAAEGDGCRRAGAPHPQDGSRAGDSGDASSCVITPGREQPGSWPPAVAGGGYRAFDAVAERLAVLTAAAPAQPVKHGGRRTHPGRGVDAAMEPGR